MPSRISGSKLPLVAHCRAAFGPGAVWPKQDVGRPATFGTAFHSAVEHWYRDGSVDLDAIAIEQGLTVDEGAHLEQVFDGWSTSRFAVLSDAIPEWPAALDVRTGQVHELPRGKGREAYDGLPSTAVCATLDLVRVDTASGVGEVHDWKTGRTKLPEAKDNWQLKFGALLLSRVHNLSSVRVYLHTVDEDGNLRTSEGEFDSIELDGIESQVGWWVAEADTGYATTKPGEHCTAMYCPIRAVCPSTVEAERELAPVDEDSPVIYPLGGEVTSPEHALWILHRIDAVQAAVDLATKMVREYADAAGGIPVDGGKRWGCFTDEWVEPDLSKATEGGMALVRMLGLDAVVEPKLSSGKIEDTLRSRGLKGKALKAEQASVLAALEGAGLTKKKSRNVYTARKGSPMGQQKEGADE